MRSALAFGFWVIALAGVTTPAQQAPPLPAPPQFNVTVSVPGSRPVRKMSDSTLNVPADNPISDAKVALGKRLFFDTLLSKDRSVSCSTCHDPAKAFTDGRPLAVGVFGRVGGRHAPSLVNRGFGRIQFWDGRVATLEALALQPISNPNEMDLALDEALSRLTANDSYRSQFQTVFGRPVSGDDLSHALATYLRMVKSYESPYDRFVEGDTSALTAEQQQGLQIFRTKAHCSICHNEPLFTSDQFENTGIAWQPPRNDAPGVYKDEGRAKVSGLERDKGKFKVPTLREIASTAPYMHDGSLATLADVVDFYDRGGRPNPNLFLTIKPLGLTAEEKRALIKFMEALSGTVTGR